MAPVVGSAPALVVVLAVLTRFPPQSELIFLSSTRDDMSTPASPRRPATHSPPFSSRVIWRTDLSGISKVSV